MRAGDQFNGTSDETETLDTYGRDMSPFLAHPLSGEEGDFISAPGHIYEDPTPSHHGLSTGFNHGNISSAVLMHNTQSMGVHPLVSSHPFYDENDENDVPNGLPSPQYHGADDTHGVGWAGHF